MVFLIDLRERLRDKDAIYVVNLRNLERYQQMFFGKTKIGRKIHCVIQKQGDKKVETKWIEEGESQSIVTKLMLDALLVISYAF